MYTRCPKCGHAPLPANQALPAACGNCGLILAKFGQVPARPVRGARPASHVHGAFQAANDALALHDGDDGEAAGEPARSLLGRLTQVPERVDSMRFMARCALLAGFAVWGWMLVGLDFRIGEFNQSFIHRPLLIFHEAGHVVFMILGHWMMVLGGTLGQLIMPLVLGGALLWKNRDPFGAAIGLWLFGVSLLDVAPYVYDALEPQLILLNGSTGEEGGHDWIFLLSSMGLLAKSHMLGALVHKLGAAVVVLALAWAALILKLQYPRIAGDVLHEEG